MAPYRRRNDPGPRAPKRTVIVEGVAEALNFLMAEKRQYAQLRRQQQQQRGGHRGGQRGGQRGGRSKVQKRLQNGGARKQQSPVAPCYDGRMIIGDSIALRLARHLGLHAPKDMPLCRGGLTLPQLQFNLSRPEIDFGKKDVVVMVGTNDVLQGKKISKEDVKILFETCRRKGAGEIFLFSLPPPHDTREIGVETVNNLIKEANDPAQNFHVVDGYSRFMKDGKREEKFFERFYHNSTKLDLVHPNSEGLEALKEELENFITSLMTDIGTPV